MPRRKRGRDKPRGRSRNRKHDHPRLNTRATWMISQPKPEVQYETLTGPPRWEQRREPFPEDRALEDVLGMYIVEGKRNLEGTKEKEVDT